jgi:hypothetical protein
MFRFPHVLRGEVIEFFLQVRTGAIPPTCSSLRGQLIHKKDERRSNRIGFESLKNRFATIPAVGSYEVTLTESQGFLTGCSPDGKVGHPRLLKEVNVWESGQRGTDSTK